MTDETVKKINRVAPWIAILSIGLAVLWMRARVDVMEEDIAVLVRFQTRVHHAVMTNYENEKRLHKRQEDLNSRYFEIMERVEAIDFERGELVNRSR